MDTDFISTLHAERANILSAQGLLTTRLVRLEALLAVYQPGAEMRPQTDPNMHRAPSPAAEPEAVECSAPHSEAPTPLPEGGGQRAPSVETRPAEAMTSAMELSLDGSGEVHGRYESTSPSNSAETPTDEAGAASSSESNHRAHYVGSWVRNDERDQVAIDAHPKAPEPAPAGEAATSPAPTIKDRVKALHDQHPEYTARQACEALGISYGSLSGHSSHLGVRWAPEKRGMKRAAPEPEPPATYRTGSVGDRVRIVHEQHPTWTARMIANHIGQNEKTVANILGELRRQPAAPPPSEFEGTADLVGHYSDVAKRLGKA